jgi:hypothetical protein
MGLSTDHPRSSIVLDCETSALSDAAKYLEEPAPPANFSKPDTIAAWIAKAKVEQLEKASLDMDLARVVCIGVQQEYSPPVVQLCRDENEERRALAGLWHILGPYPYPRILGWNVLWDLQMLQRRSFYLGVTSPAIELGKWRHPDVSDIMLMWSYDGQRPFRSLTWVCKRLSIVVDDPLSGGGADVPQAIAEGRWDDVRSHCEADVKRTAAVAARMGLFGG